VESEDRPGSHGESVLAVPATPLPTSLDVVVLRDASAAGAGDFLTRAPAQLPKQLERLLVGQRVEALDRERAGFGGKEEVLVVGQELCFR